MEFSDCVGFHKYRFISIGVIPDFVDQAPLIDMAMDFVLRNMSVCYFLVLSVLLMYPSLFY